MRSIATAWLALFVCLGLADSAQAHRQTGKTRVLVLCTGNSARSQMTEGFLKSFDSSLEVFSAGTAPAPKVNPYAVQVMKELGIDISRGTPKNVSEFLGESFDYVITVCDDADKNCPNFRGNVGKRLHIGFPDPAKATGTDEEKLAVFRQVRDGIKRRFQLLYDEEIKTSTKDAHSVEELTKRILLALEKKDAPALRKLSINRPEYEQAFWPDVKFRMPLRGPADGYEQHINASTRQLEARLAESRGKRLELIRLTHTSPKERRGSKEYRNLAAVVRDGGEERTLILAGWVLERDGIFKVGSYHAPAGK